VRSKAIVQWVSGFSMGEVILITFYYSAMTYLNRALTTSNAYLQIVIFGKNVNILDVSGSKPLIYGKKSSELGNNLDTKDFCI